MDIKDFPKLQSPFIRRTIDDFKVDDKVQPIEERMKSYFGKNHGVAHQKWHHLVSDKKPEEAVDISLVTFFRENWNANFWKQ